jgi:hypothetical protein
VTRTTPRRRRSRPRWHIRLTRDLVLFSVGVAGLVYEITIGGGRPEVMTVCCATTNAATSEHAAPIPGHPRLLALLPRAGDAARGGDTVKRLSRARLWLRGRPFTTAFLVMAILVSGGFYSISRFQDCMNGWAQDYSDRALKLSGPSIDRVNFFLQAYTEAAGAKHAPLTPAGKQRLIAELDKDRADFSVMPKHADLEKQPDYQLLALRDLVKSLRANSRYLTVSDANPVPEAPNCGGIL